MDPTFSKLDFLFCCLITSIHYTNYLRLIRLNGGGNKTVWNNSKRMKTEKWSFCFMSTKWFLLEVCSIRLSLNSDWFLSPDEKRSLSMTLSPPCFAAGLLFPAGWKVVGLRHTCPSWPKSSEFGLIWPKHLPNSSAFFFFTFSLLLFYKTSSSSGSSLVSWIILIFFLTNALFTRLDHPQVDHVATASGQGFNATGICTFQFYIVLYYYVNHFF